MRGVERRRPRTPSSIRAKSYAPSREPPDPAGLHRLIFTSEARKPGDSDHAPLTPPGEINAIVEAHRPRTRFTGALIAAGDHLIQVIEGEARCLEAVFESLCKDMRHRNVSLLEFSPIHARGFDEWTLLDTARHRDRVARSLNDLLSCVDKGMDPADIAEHLQAMLGKAR